MKKYLFIVIMITLVFLPLNYAFAQHQEDTGAKNTDVNTQKKSSEDRKWQKGPDFLEPGAEMQPLEKESKGMSSIKIKLPEGYKIPPHWYKNKVRIDVLSGVFYMGSGKQIEKENAVPINAGEHRVLPPEMSSYGFVDGPAIIKLTTVAPWDIKYVNPKDDPRKNK